MYRKSLEAIDCSTARALDQVGEWWSLMLVRECLAGTKRFDDFQKRLGIARNVLTSRLAHLCEHGIIEKTPLDGSERFFEYRLTAKGEALYPVLIALLQWGDRWTGSGNGGPIELVDHQTGEPIPTMGPRSADGRALGLRDVRYEAREHASKQTRRVIAQRNRHVLGIDDAAAAAGEDAQDDAEENPPR
ncbi:helix-turn-helix domain-containing protein [Paraburkholderia jirisanensis]